MEMNLNWETGRLIATFKRFEKLGIYIQRNDFGEIKKECERLMADLEAGAEKAALEQIKHKAESMSMG